MNVEEISEIENKMYRKSLDLLADHVRKVQDAVRGLVNSFDSFLSSKTNILQKDYEKISQLEEEADVYKLELIDQLTKAAPGLLYREDFMRLAFKIDEIAELAQSITRLELKLVEQKWVPNYSIADGLKIMAAEVLSTHEKLRDTVMALSMNPMRALQLVGEVHAYEAKVDRTYQDLDFKALIEVREFGKLLIYRDLLSMLERMADAMEDASDDARILAMHRVA